MATGGKSFEPTLGELYAYYLGRVAQILVIEMNLGAPRAGFARGVFDFWRVAHPCIF
jgi:hypothetical protein